MAELSGTGGMVYIGADIGGIKSWTLDYTVDMLDTTDFTDGNATNAARTFKPGLSTWSGSFEGYKDGAPQGLGFASSVTLKLEEDSTYFWTGSAYITGLHETTAVDGVITISYDFQGTGELTESVG
uniref:Putative tail protein n=1 Tax=viral metagenome TaxID=1070528 RepID=A0A6M3IPB5_9ZZZZ